MRESSSANNARSFYHATPVSVTVLCIVLVLISIANKASHDQLFMYKHQICSLKVKILNISRQETGIKVEYKIVLLTGWLYERRAATKQAAPTNVTLFVKT